MAEARKRVTVDVRAKTAAARKRLKELRREMTQQGRTAAQVSKSYVSMSGRLRQVERQMDAMARRVGQVSKILGAAGLVGVAAGAVRTFDDLMTSTLKYQDVMKNLPFSLDKARAATGGLVGDLELAKAANTAARLGVAKTAEEFAKLAEAGSKLARSLGGDATEGVETLTIALARGSALRLDDLGIQLKMNEAYAEYAEQLHKSANELTDAEKQQAFMVVGLKKAVEAAKNVKLANESAASSWVRLKTEMQNLARDVVPKVADAMLFVVDGIRGLSDELERALEALSVFSDKFDDIDQKRARRGTQGIIDQLISEGRMDEAKALLERQAAEMRQQVEAARARNAQIRQENEKIQEQLNVIEERKRARDARRKARGGPSGPRYDVTEETRQFIGPSAIDPKDVLEQERILTDNIVELEEARARLIFDRRMRSLEEQRAAGVDPVSLIEQEKQARLDLLAAQERMLEREQDMQTQRIESLRIQSEREQVMFDARMQRMEIEAQRMAKQRKLWQQFAEDVAGAHGQMLAAAIIGSKGSAQAFFGLVKNFAAAQATQMAILAASELAKGIAAAASYNYAEASAHFSASALAAAKGVIFGSIAGGAALAGRGIGGLGGGGGTGGFAPEFGGGQRGRQAPAGQRSTAVSPTSQQSPPPQQASRGGGVVNININGGLFAQDRETLALELRQVLREGERRFGTA